MPHPRRTPRKTQRTSRTIKPLEELKIVHPHAAGLDIGATEIWACVPVLPRMYGGLAPLRPICRRWPIG
jgi:hypothetical protein